MYSTKQRIYTYFDKTQKSALCSFLRSFVSVEVKNTENITPQMIFEKFMEEQEYYFKLELPKFPFLKDYIDNENFLSETKEFIVACKKYYDYKKSQAPLIAKQKEYDKQKRKYLQELKMSKEPPTKKQLYYYERLCKKYNIEKKDTTLLSKLDLKNELERIIDEHSRDCKNIDIRRD